jgi:hypothetical protein
MALIGVNSCVLSALNVLLLDDLCDIGNYASPTTSYRIQEA